MVLVGPREEGGLIKVGKVMGMSVRNLDVHYHGNPRDQVEGSYVTGWLLPDTGLQARPRRHYFKHGTALDRTHRPLTAGALRDVIEMSQLVCWGFQLTQDGRLPREVLSRLHTDSRVSWTSSEMGLRGSE